MVQLQEVPLLEVPVVGPRAAAGRQPAAQKVVVAAVPFSVAAHAPAAGQLVRPEVSVRQAQGLLLAARHEAQPAAKVAAPTDAGLVAEEAAGEPDVVVAAVVVAAELPVVPVGLLSGPPWAAAWAFRQDRVLPWPVPPRSAPTARAMELSPTA